MPSHDRSLSNELNEEDKKKLIKDAIFFLIAQESKRPLFKKADVFKAIGLTGRGNNLQDEIWTQALKQIKDVFGFDLRELTTKKGCFILVNRYEDSPDPENRHLEFSDVEKAHMGLLTIVLSVIYMNNGSIKQDSLFHFLSKLKLHDENSVKNEVDVFGNVKNLIEKEWCIRHQYIHMEKDKSSDPEHVQSIYSWGERAELEVKKSDILKFVASVYDKPVQDFTEQYQRILNEEGEDIFAEDAS